jgi:acetyl esterase/lipase
MTRSVLLLVSVLFLPLLPLYGAGDLSIQSPGKSEFAAKTYVFKKVGNVEIRADVHRANDTKKRPVLVWLHGGALIMGSRTAVPQNLRELCRAEGYVLVSLDYRLAPEVKLPDIIQDVEDAMAWLRGEDARKELHLDPNKMVVAGGSAGGYLTLMTGPRMKPRPSALVAYWGYGDVDGDWYTKPSEHYRTSAALVSKEVAYQGVGGKVLTGTDVLSKMDAAARSKYYLYLRQNGLWTKEVTGFDPDKERRKLDPYCPVRNITSDYPPTLMIHGTKDTDVPYELSANMATELKKHKVPHELVSVAGAGHGLSGADKRLVTDAHDRALAFIRRHLNSQKNR